TSRLPDGTSSTPRSRARSPFRPNSRPASRRWSVKPSPASRPPVYLQGGMDDEARTPPDRSITRPQRELVIRRAVELYAAQTDADERLSEDEVLRIGKELVLPSAIVRQAIYEAPAPSTTSIVDRWFGAAAVSVSRAVPLPDGDVASRL